MNAAGSVTDVLSFISGFLIKNFENGESVFFGFLVTTLLWLSIIYSIKQVAKMFGFFIWMNNRELIWCENILSKSNLEQVDIDNITAIKNNVIRYKVTGFKDVKKQNILVGISNKNKGLITAGFFKKFRPWLIIKDESIMFEKNTFFYIKFFSYRALIIIYITLACFLFYFYIVAVMEMLFYECFVYVIGMIFCVIMILTLYKLAPTKEEQKLLEQVLKTQSNIDEVVIRLNFRSKFITLFHKMKSHITP